MLDDGSTLLYLVRSQTSLDEESADDAVDGLPICQGVLVRPPSSTDADAKNPTGRMEAWITPLSEVPADGDIAKEQVDVFEMAVAKVVDSLLLQRLLLERSEESADGIDAMADLILGVDVGSDADDALSSLFQKAISSRGLVSVTNDDNEEDESRMMFRIDYGRMVRSYSELAIEYRGTTLGMEALEILGLTSSRRVPYHFRDDLDSYSRKSTSGNASTRNVVSPQRDLLPKEIVHQIKDIMATIEGNGWLSTNLDSVDNLPSLHLNLISGGETIFSTMGGDNEANDDNGVDTPMTFENSIGKLWRLVKPFLEDTLLSNVRQVMGSSTVEISDVFIRRYGEDVQPDHSAATRYGISAHFDVTASTTSVVALDDVAAEGKSGLYTTEKSEVCTNHAALRRYFPLGAGDAVVHTWDVLHGVEIDPGQQRTSLIVWFEDRGRDGNQSPAFPPWLSNPSIDDDIGQFVLATATSGSVDENMLPSTENDGSDDDFHPHNLYIRSAALGNAFALASLGSLCNESALSSEFVAKTKTMLRKLRDIGEDETYNRTVGTEAEAKALAIELWHEAAIRGNPLAQTSLADDYMGQSMEAMRAGGDGNNDRSNELRLKAAMLFALAAQQGYDDALQALPRVLNVESSARKSAEDFYNSPVFQVAQAVLA